MNMKKAMLTIPLSAALLFPAAHSASAHEGHMHGEAKKTSSSQEVSNKAADFRAAELPGADRLMTLRADPSGDPAFNSSKN